MNDPDREDLRLPDSVARQLKGAFGGTPPVDPEVDRRIRGRIAEHFTAIRHRRWWRQRGLPWVAAASVLVALLLFLGRPPSADLPARVVAREDIDADGRIDMLDAFALARTLRDRGGEAPAAWDLDGDGRVDRSDVDLVAAAAVRLAPR